MIEPHELRIGNLVTINNSRAWPDLKDIPLTVIELSTEMDEYEKELFPKSKGTITLKGYIETYNQFSQFVEPIELTEDWLLKFGFEREDEGSVSAQFNFGANPVTKDYLLSLIWIKDYNNDYKLTGFPFFRNGYFKIKTVHQLQNLCHSLCGEELKIKES